MIPLSPLPSFFSPWVLSECCVCVLDKRVPFLIFSCVLGFGFIFFLFLFLQRWIGFSPFLDDFFSHPSFAVVSPNESRRAVLR